MVFQTAPLRKTLRIQGPINARLYTSSPDRRRHAVGLVSDVAPDGTVTRLTGGWQTVAHARCSTRASPATSTAS